MTIIIHLFRSRVQCACLAFVLTLLASACSHDTVRSGAANWPGTQQLVLVTTSDWNATNGKLQRYVRNGSSWEQIGASTPVVIGRTGSAWGLGLHPTQSGGPIKKEGDGRAPAGVFRIGEAFGYANSVTTALPYLPMQATNYCMDVPASPLYNRIVDARVVGEAAVQGSTEPMRLDIHNKGDQRYKSGFIIEHNAQAVPGAGSCIFAHLWKTSANTTAGCTAMEEPAMRDLLAWLRADAYPVFVLLPQAEYQRVQARWNLPSDTGS
ncbi:MAG: hypothetical protein M3Q13_06460 [Pseudomonadota bacterium]|nr:hypothetical protein [Pseudomonadota bacterium]